VDDGSTDETPARLAGFIGRIPQMPIPVPELAYIAVVCGA